MKKLLKIGMLVFLISLVGLVFAACDESHTPITLATPQNLKVLYDLKENKTVGYELIWDEVENATAYEVKISDNKIDAYQAKLDISEYVTTGRTYAIRITAKGDNDNYTDSEMAVLSSKIEELTKDFEFTLLEDATYKVSAENLPNSAITGRVVFPDNYLGKTISTLAESSFDRSTLTINGIKGSDNEYTTSVKLPANLKVVEDYAFYGCKKIEEVVLPQTVTFIGSGAFSACEALTTINMPQNLIEIGSSCFGNCTSLKNIELPEGVKNIGSSAFYGCELVNITTIPQSVESIGSGAFTRTVYYNDQSNWQNGTLYLDNCLLKVNTDISGTFTIKEGTRIIARGAFAGCDKLTEVIITEGVKRIENSMFSNKVSLVSIIIPKSVKEIGESAFLNCRSLTSINLSKGITKIGETVFSYCPLLETINFDGTMAEWLAIEKGEYWCDNTGDFTVICTDGKLDKDGNVVE